MKGKKILALILAILTTLLVFSGCAKSKTQDENSANKSTEKQTIKIWGKNSGVDPAMQAVIDKFNSSQDKYQVKYEFYGDNYANVVTMALSSGDAPDIFEEGGNFSVPALAKQGLIIPVDDVFTSDIKDKIFPAALNEKSFIYDGKLYAVATRVSAFRLLYNKDLFKEAGLDPNSPPKTLEELREYAKKITAAGNGKFYGFGIYCGSSNIMERILDPVVIAAGKAGAFGYDYNKGQYDFSTGKRVLQFYIDLAKDGSLFPGYETLTVDQMRANFAKGNVAMYIDGNWTSGTYATQIKTTIDWSAAAIPVFADETYGKGQAFAGVDYCISKSSKSQEGAKQFLTFLLKNGDVYNKYKPEPKVYLPANDPSKLPVKELNLKGYEVNFKTDDLASLPFNVTPLLKLEGDTRNKVFLNDFVKASKGEAVDIDKDIQDLNTRYNKALNDAISRGELKKEEITIPNYDMNNRK